MSCEEEVLKPAASSEGYFINYKANTEDLRRDLQAKAAAAAKESGGLSLNAAQSSKCFTFGTTAKQSTRFFPYSEVYKKFDRRLTTFKSWPKSIPINPDDLARAGFLYTGEGDKVFCPWCNICLIQWETYDNPFDEHKKHSPNCDYILMLFSK